MLEEISQYIPILAIFVLSAWMVGFRTRSGRILTPGGGLHLQIFIFFGLGGVCFFVFDSSEPSILKTEILGYAIGAAYPLLIGYFIAGIIEISRSNNNSVRAKKTSDIGHIHIGFLFCLYVTGFLGLLLEGEASKEGFGAFFTYLKLLFFPSMLLMIIQKGRSGFLGWFSILSVVIGGIFIGFYSPWRSMLVIVIATFLLGVAIRSPKWFFPTCFSAAVMLAFVIPFQLVKRQQKDVFENDPTGVLLASLELTIDERFFLIGEFISVRLNYLRELGYVSRALDAGFQLRDGETYFGVIYQVIPRVLWADKPFLAEWAGFDLPRLIGLLQYNDPSTSWAVNVFAEASYNYGVWCLVWFVPVSFIFLDYIERFSSFIYRTKGGIAIGNVLFFYLTLCTVTIIFFASLTIASLVLLKIIDFLLCYQYFSMSRKTVSQG